MKVTIEAIPTVQIGNKGVLIRIRDEQGTNLGKLWVGQAQVRWAAGSIPERNAKKVSVRNFVTFLNTLP